MKVILDSNSKLMEEYTQILWKNKIEYFYIPRSNYGCFAEIYAIDIYKQVIDDADEVVFIGNIGDFHSHGIGYRFINEAKEFNIEINDYTKHRSIHPNDDTIFCNFNWPKTGESFTIDDTSIYYDKSVDRYISDVLHEGEISVSWSIGEYNKYAEPIIHIHCEGEIPETIKLQEKVLDAICNIFNLKRFTYERG